MFTLEMSRFVFLENIPQDDPSDRTGSCNLKTQSAPCLTFINIVTLGKIDFGCFASMSELVFNLQSVWEIRTMIVLKS